MENRRQSLLIPEIPPNALDAKYLDSSSNHFSNNLFIDSLRPTLNAVGLKKCLTVGNVCLPEKSADDGIRKQAARALVNEYFIPVQEVQDLYDKIDCAIKDGYKHRSSNVYNYQHQLANFSRAMKDDEFAWRDKAQKAFRANSFFVYGDAGSGASAAIQRCLNTYPQVIWHDRVHQSQIVHLTIDLLGIQTPLEYCVMFFKALEYALGPEKFAHEVEVSRSVSAALLKIDSLVLTYNVGILAIDSLDSINDWKETERIRILKHFHSLGKSLPILYSGTTEAFDSVVLNMPWMLDSLSFGSIHWDPLKRLEKNSEEAQLRWSLFTKRLWKQQCLRNSTAVPTEEIKAVWYGACQGVMQLAVSFYSLCHIEAITSGEESITVELMHRVWRKESRPLELALMAFNNNNTGLLPPIQTVEANNSPNNIRKTSEVKKISTFQNQVNTDFKKIPKKEWGKLPENDLRYMFSVCKEEHFYDELKRCELVLTMQDLMGNVQLPRT